MWKSVSNKTVGVPNETVGIGMRQGIIVRDGGLVGQ